jgi:hypothetical protein
MDIATLAISKLQETRRAMRLAVFSEGLVYVVTSTGKLQSWKFLEDEFDEAEVLSMPTLEGKVAVMVQDMESKALVLGTTAGEIAVVDTKKGVSKMVRMKNAAHGGLGVPVVALAVEEGRIFALGAGGNLAVFQTSDLKLIAHRNLKKCGLNAREAGNLKFLEVRLDKVFVASETKILTLDLAMVLPNGSGSAAKVVDSVEAGLGLIYGFSVSGGEFSCPPIKRPRRLAPEQPVVVFAADPNDLNLPPVFTRKSFL